MRIFHGPQNISGMAGVLAKAQRRLGFEAYSHCYSTGKFNYPVDFEIGGNTRREKQWNLIKKFGREAFSSNIFQFYFGESLAGANLWDVALLRKLRKKIFFYFCGCDVRDSKLTIQKYQYSACKECWPMACSANRLKAIKTALKYAHGIFVSTPDLLEFLPGSVLLPQPIEYENFKNLCSRVIQQNDIRKNLSDKIIIAHAPSNRVIKGTKYIEQAVTELNSKGYHIELRLIQNKSYDEALALCASSDFVIDQLLVGAYGQFSVEMMALGKPVICYIRSDLQQHYDSKLPIVNANPENISTVISDLIENRESWEKYSNQGIDYVKNIHCSDVVAKATLNAYQKI